MTDDQGSILRFVSLMLFTALVLIGALAAPTDRHLYQGRDTTIVGPWPVRLRDSNLIQGQPDPPVRVNDMVTGGVEPGQLITCSHGVMNLSQDEIDVALSLSAEMGSTVGMYAGDGSAPAVPLTPITNPLPLSRYEYRHVWLVGEIPVGAAGVEAWTLTASVAGATQNASRTDLFWIGDWTAPPEGPPTSEPKRVLLPMVT